ncbi:unnamed protein product [Vitrella brassicaformis CCMP3155]|uniref:Uncharacterized protein n=1 Tax=Vitrella brassicaformis (strain CCMP3155) TaxID=1169540 RepID=A0A0G4FCU2_VITBC|nr:unnamed protein product [Vitrella brassicaformis CCMP3155]|eukprot:CEM10980.1 unnamed protein product [Vitrella brassicaformis CCMP3155]
MAVHILQTEFADRLNSIDDAVQDFIMTETPMPVGTPAQQDEPHHGHSPPTSPQAGEAARSSFVPRPPPVQSSRVPPKQLLSDDNIYADALSPLTSPANRGSIVSKTPVARNIPLRSSFRVKVVEGEKGRSVEQRRKSVEISLPPEMMKKVLNGEALTQTDTKVYYPEFIASYINPLVGTLIIAIGLIVSLWMVTDNPLAMVCIIPFVPFWVWFVIRIPLTLTRDVEKRKYILRFVAKTRMVPFNEIITIEKYSQTVAEGEVQPSCTWFFFLTWNSGGVTNPSDTVCIRLLTSTLYFSPECGAKRFIKDNKKFLPSSRRGSRRVSRQSHRSQSRSSNVLLSSSGAFAPFEQPQQQLGEGQGDQRGDEEGGGTNNMENRPSFVSFEWQTSEIPPERQNTKTNKEDDDQPV